MKALFRGTQVVFIGFLLYADVGGLKVKNVAMVTIIVLAYCLTFLPMAQISGCGSIVAQIWFWPSWALAALIFTLIDDKMTDRGTRDETTSLTA